MEQEKKICCICGREFTEWGNNPWPVKEDGVCCRACSFGVVLPKRMELRNKQEKNSRL